MLGRTNPGLSDDELLHDDLVRQVVEETDPMRGVPIPPAPIGPFGVPAARAHRAAPRRTLLAAAAVALAVLSIAGTVGVLRNVDGDRVVPQPAQRIAVPLPLAVPDQPVGPARERLRELLAQVRKRSTSATPTGRYSFIRQQVWSVTTTLPSIGPESGTARDEQLWWAEDRSALERITVLPVGADDARLARWTDQLPADAVTESRTYRAGELAVVLDRPSSDPAVLAGQLSGHQPFQDGPQSPLRAVVDMQQFHVLNPAQMAAALRVLVDTDGLQYRGEVTDRAGRPGVAVSVDSDNGATRDVAVFDAVNGDLLSYERVALLDPTRQRRTPAVVSYVLFLARGNTDEIGQPVGN